METVLRAFVRRSREILKENLAGIYLHGSAVMGCFHPAKSDIDLIVVIREKIPGDVKRAFMEMTVELNRLAPPKGIEMSVVLGSVCDPFVYPTPYELHFSVSHLARFQSDPDAYVRQMNGTDRDLAAHFTVIRKRGKCLYGLPVDEAFGEVPKEDYLDSIRFDVEGAREEILGDPMYLILNLARVLAFRREEAVLSKKEGGEWALENLPEEYHALVRNALKEYAGGADHSYDPDTAERYADYMLRQIL